MVAIVIGMGGTNTSLGCDKTGIGTARSGGSSPQLVGIPVILSLGTTNGRGGEEELGKKTTIGKWQRHLTQRRLPRGRKTPGQIQMKQTHLSLPRSDVIKLTTPHVPQSRKGPMPHNPQSR